MPKLSTTSDKNNILDAWIMVEQLSEGSIKLTEKNKFKALIDDDLEQSDWQAFFRQKYQQWENGRLTKGKKLDKRKSGILFYFDIFNFENDILRFLREKHNFSKPEESFRIGDKFGIFLCFDSKFELQVDKIFINVAHYFRQKASLPTQKEFDKFEYELKEEISTYFNENFNFGFNRLKQKYGITMHEFRYAFNQNINKAAMNFHSFFIADLQRAKRADSDNLARYLFGFDSENRKNLVTKNPDLTDIALINKILEPKNYPLGRFPSNTNHALSLMQQIAVNLAFLGDKNDFIRSVNGPPGTGKTTLLRDIFAEFVVRQAKAIVDLENKSLKEGVEYDYTKDGQQKQAILAKLPREITEYNTLLASSNNGAVQNIVNEMPLLKELDEDLRQEVLAANYFSVIANNGNKDSDDIKKWGSFSLEGGKKANVDTILATAQAIVDELKTNDDTQDAVYEEFSELYAELFTIRTKMQSYCEKVKLNIVEKNEVMQMESELPDLKLEVKNKIEQIEKEMEAAKINLITKQNEISHELALIERQSQNVSTELNLLSKKIEIQRLKVKEIDLKRTTLEQEKPNRLWLKKMFAKDKLVEYNEKMNQCSQESYQAQIELNHLLEQEYEISKEEALHSSRIAALEVEKKKNNTEYEEYCHRQKEIINLKNEKLKSKEQDIFDKKLEHFQHLAEMERFIQHELQIHFKEKLIIKTLDFNMDYRSLQLFNPWFNKEFRIMQSRLFILALKVRKQFLSKNKWHLSKAKMIWQNQYAYREKAYGEELITLSWQWLNFTIPLISTTFASFGRMFQQLGANTISNLFVDEAGQALPQASVGAIYRSQKVMVVGDPAQIKPVWTLEDKVLNIIGRIYRVGEKYLSQNASTQSLIDATSKYGFYKSEDEWIGIPLWVHRRCQRPMFDIANRISYNDLMVLGIDEEDAKGKAIWYNVSGYAKDKFVEEQARFLQAEIAKKLIEVKAALGDNPENKDEREQIYVITPFSNVADKLIQYLGVFVKRDKSGKALNVGTVHTFQGKEARVVYLVLGADENSKGAATWAVSEPNIINVAATRAKKEFYVIGDKKLYADLSQHSRDCYQIISDYN